MSELAQKGSPQKGSQSCSPRVFLAVDLGASSGRVVAGQFDGQHLTITEVHRFGNGPVHVGDRMYWDFLRQWSEVQLGLGLAAGQFGPAIDSVGVDTWGVDFGLLGAGDELLGNPRHYRDQRTQGGLARAFEEISSAAIYDATGVQFMELNTLYQLLAIRDEAPELLHQARRFLMMPDLFHWHLTGTASNEFTNATTTQCFDSRAGSWAVKLLDRLQIPTHLFSAVCAPGTDLGLVRTKVAGSLGLAPHVRVILPGTHDTASAVLAVPSAEPVQAHPNWCYVSSGTWSLMGVELPQPIISSRCRELNFTNEGGVGNTVRLLRNIAGLWLVQECRRCWELQGDPLSWSQLTRLAEEAAPLVSIVNPDDPSLTAPASMPLAIAQLCSHSGQPIPHSKGEIVRCALESLAMRYRVVLGWLEELVGNRIERIHIVGGGTQNRFLCQMVADACDRPVTAGPVEATALGNLAMQMVACGAVGSIAEARLLVRTSFPVDDYEPRNVGTWNDRFEQCQDLFR
ncbi:MAG: rhamnulokinase [Planctomycetota bacterium]|nr:rhamnulokinase [Planctomycetota bacterium]MDA1177564.1 rhamnulokinase [Planctomycetota bacterium]